MTAEGEFDLSEILQQETSSLSKWFADIRPWDPGSKVRDKLVWLNISEVPVHAWKDEVFKTIVQIVGRFGMLDDATRCKERFDIARMLISSRYPEVINRSVKVQINEKIYVIRLMEDTHFNRTRFFRLTRVIP